MQKITLGLAITAVASLLLTLPACGSKKQLDQTTAALRIAAEGDHYTTFKALAHPLLCAKFPPAQLTRLSKALEKLGAFKERTLHGISVKTGGKREGQYTLRYEKGNVELEVVVVAGKVVSFNFSGDDLEKALKAEQLARYAKFEVGNFTFLQQPGGKDKRSNIFKIGERIAFRLRIHGLKLVEKTIFFVADLEVTSDGEQILSRPNFAKSDKPIATKGMPVGTLNGTITLPKIPATYIAHFKITDRHAKRSLAFKQAIVVQP